MSETEDGKLKVHHTDSVLDLPDDVRMQIFAAAALDSLPGPETHPSSQTKVLCPDCGEAIEHVEVESSDSISRKVLDMVRYEVNDTTIGVCPDCGAAMAW